MSEDKAPRGCVALTLEEFDALCMAVLACEGAGTGLYKKLCTMRAALIKRVGETVEAVDLTR